MEDESMFFNKVAVLANVSFETTDREPAVLVDNK
jgi:hypothetical protein